MRFLGLDLGTKTLGIAVSDALGMLSTPLKVIRFNNSKETIKPLEELINYYKVNTLVLGLPKNMDGSLGFASKRSLEYKELLEEYFALPIILVDERLSTMEAENILLNEDLSRKKRKNKIDGVAASIILDTYLRMRGNADEREKWKYFYFKRWEG